MTFCVPAFYFIAGYFLHFETFKLRLHSREEYGPLITKKIRRYLIPSIFFTLVPFFYTGLMELCHLRTAHYFIPSLILIIIAYCGLDALINKFKDSTKTAILIAYCTFTTLLMLAIHNIPVYGYLHWRQALHENLFFIIGVVVAINRNYIEQKCKKFGTLILLWIIYIITYICLYHLPTPLQGYTYKAFYQVISPIAGIFAIYAFFTYISESFTRHTRLGRLAFYLGNRSLPLYIMQDLIFFIFLYFIDTSKVPHPEIAALLIFILTAFLVCVLYDLLCLIPFIRCHLFHLP